MRGLQLRIINDDCLNVVKTFESESIDLIYLDPPFNTGKDWKQFDDRFKPDLQSRQQTTGKLRQLLDVFNLGYCDYMAIRLKELHRVLKPTGSLYLHCDPTASHYIKLILDAVFGHENFRNEIVWKRRTNTVMGKSSKFQTNSDSIFFYSKTINNIFNTQYESYPDEYYKRFKYEDEKGKYRWNVKAHYSEENIQNLINKGEAKFTENGKYPSFKQYLHELKGKPYQNIWTDIAMVNAMATERLGYPTQKPEALLERIIKASSNEGDLILDPFCGCGTTIAVAERLKRRWIGIDINPQAVELTTKRLNQVYSRRQNEMAL